MITALWLTAGLAAGGAAPPAPRPERDARARVALAAAAERYGDALLGALETSRHPRELLLAARLRRSKGWDAGRGGDGSAQMRHETAADALLQRAIERGADDPVVWWEVAGACPHAPALCAVDDPVVRLRELAPGNAAVWLRPRLGAPPGDEAGPRLARIAAASGYDSYLGERLRAWTTAGPHIPVPAELSAELGDATAARAALIMAYLLAEAGFEHPQWRGLCGKDALAEADAARATACRQALDRSLVQADSLTAYYTAWSVRHALETEPAARAALERARAAIEWQVAAMTELSLAGEPASQRAVQAEQIARWRAPGATEFSMLRGLLDAHGIPATPPAGWRSVRAIGPVRGAALP